MADSPRAAGLLARAGAARGRHQSAGLAAGRHDLRSLDGSDRLGGPIAEHEPDLVLHGHAHGGTFEGRIGPVPVYNVSVPVIERDFWLFELEVAQRARSAIH